VDDVDDDIVYSDVGSDQSPTICANSDDEEDGGVVPCEQNRLLIKVKRRLCSDG